MIPRTLTIKNFLSYGAVPQTISFEGYDLICLSGKNGHGKSALLDAMTWALWGAARKTAGTNKPDEGLLRLGSTQMMVLFEFGCSKGIYRVRREFSFRQGKPHATLDFAVYDAVADEYRSLTDKTIRRTQENIEQAIGLDYETFVNSAFLRQGNANEFSNKSPKDRKKVLAAILGVNQYDALQSRALERARELAHKIRVLQELQEQDAAVIATQEELVRLLNAEQGNLQQVGRLEQAGNLALQAATAQLDQAQARKRELLASVQQLAQEEAQLGQARQEWGARALAWRQGHAKSRLAGDRTSLVQSLQSARQQEAAAREKHEYQLTLVTKIAQVRQIYAACEQAEHQEQRLSSEERAGQLQAAQLVALREQGGALAAQLATVKAEQQQFDRRREWYGQRAGQAKGWYAILEELQQKEQAVAAQEAPSCPLCEQMLSAKRKQFLQHKFGQEHAQRSHAYRRLTGLLARLKQVLVQQHERLQAWEQQRHQLQTITTQIAERELQERLRRESLELLQRQIDQGREHISTLAAEYGYAISVDMTSAQLLAFFSAKLQLLQVEQQATIASERALLVARSAVGEAERALAASAEHAALVGALGEQRRQLGSQRLQLITATKALQERRQRCGSTDIDVAISQALSAQEECRRQLVGVVQEKERLLSAVGQAEIRLAQVTQRRTVYEGRQQEIAALELEKRDYTALALLWSKNGIQALLIEEAIPEIEYEANELLSRLTQHNTQVFIESLRDLKGGGVRETLDIKISDAMGVRPYEMFSGGEAFRIDFALRIAISKLLARRAGAALQLLIIDEGFGSQDEEGLSRLMNALYAVQKDFEKIIIVSHLPAFKENFPVHFVIEKLPSGSTITVEQRG